MEEKIKILEQGGLPAFVGYSISKEDAEKIKAILEQRKSDIDDYYNHTILPRLR